ISYGSAVIMESLIRDPLCWQSLTLGCLCIFLGYIVALGVNRLYLGPLAKFPGRKLAAATHWFEFYYDLIKGGRFQSKIAQMHEEYGKDCSASWSRRPTYPP
ncbi:MAG: hypothetical protein Q9179_005400, partial [Wetmoreana sp. 5 TL-2023]